MSARPKASVLHAELLTTLTGSTTSKAAFLGAAQAWLRRRLPDFEPRFRDTGDLDGLLDVELASMPLAEAELSIERALAFWRRDDAKVTWPRLCWDIHALFEDGLTVVAEDGCSACQSWCRVRVERASRLPALVCQGCPNIDWPHGTPPLPCELTFPTRDELKRLGCLPDSASGGSVS